MGSGVRRSLAVATLTVAATCLLAPVASAEPATPSLTTGSAGLTIGQIDDIIRILIPGHCSVAGSLGCVNP